MDDTKIAYLLRTFTLIGTFSYMFWRSFVMFRIYLCSSKCTFTLVFVKVYVSAVGVSMSTRRQRMSIHCASTSLHSCTPCLFVPRIFWHLSYQVVVECRLLWRLRTISRWVHILLVILHWGFPPADTRSRSKLMRNQSILQRAGCNNNVEFLWRQDTTALPSQMKQIWCHAPMPSRRYRNPTFFVSTFGHKVCLSISPPTIGS